MTKKAIKILISLVIMLLIVVMGTMVFAVSPGDIKASTGGSLHTSLTKVSGNILGAVQIIGTAVAVIMLIVLAIKYISAAPGDKAEIKKHAVVYVVGAVLLFAASNILGLIQNVAEWFSGS